MRCLIKWCPTDFNYKEEFPGISAHRLPTNVAQKKRWMDVLSEAISNVSKNSRICSLHFNDTDFYETNGKRMLRYDVVPSMNLVAVKNKISKLVSGNRIPFTNMTNSSYAHQSLPGTSKTIGNTMTAPRQPHSGTVMLADLDPNKQVTKQNRPYSIVQSLHTSKAHGDTMTMPRFPFSNTAEFASCPPSKLEKATKIQPYNLVYCQPAIPPVITEKAQSLKRFQQIPPYSIVQSPHTSKALGNTMTVPRQPHSSTVMQADLDPNKQLTKQNRPYSIVQSLHTSKALGDTLTMPRFPFSNTAELASCQPSKLEEVTKIQPYSNVYWQPVIPPVITGEAQSLKRFQFDGDAKENLPNQCKEKQPIIQITNDVPILPRMLPGSNSTTKPSWLPASRLQNRTKRIHNLIRKRTHYGDHANGESSDSLRTKEQTILEVSQQPPNQSQNTSKQMKLSPIAIVSKKSIQNVHASVSGSQASIVPNPEHQLMVASHQEKRIRYAGDIKDLSIITPDAAKQALPRVLHQLHESQKRVNRLKQQNMRLRRNTNRFAEIMAELRAKQIITAGGEVILQKFSSNSELLEELNNIRRGLPFSEAVRSFATTLNFYSSKAYRFVRKAFDNTLPHERTVASWYRTVDGEPGITVESLNVLEAKSKEMTSVGRQLLVSLTMDEVAIRQLVEWNPHKKKFDGVVDYGASLSFLIEGDDLVTAKEALVFMISSVEDDWKIPVAYYLISGLKTHDKKQIVESVLIALQDVGAKVVGFTFDGTATNISMANALGCNLKIDKSVPLVTHFQHPTGDHLVYVFLDACHMLKLIRNVFCSQSVISTMNGEARWEFIKKLNEFQNLTGMKLAPKLSDNHVNFQNQKMKVKLATQTLSKSVADAIKVLERHDPAFSESNATIELVSLINNIFDVLNSKDCQASKFKQLLCKENFEEINATLTYAETYIRSLKLMSNQPILQSQSKTGFLGFLINIQSFRNMFKELVVEKGILTMIRAYRFSQDHVETFFAAVRSKGGSNNNPSAAQFKAAYKRLLTHHNITAPPKANCTEFGDTTMLSVLMGPYRHEHNSGTTEPNLGQSFDGTSEEVLIMGEAVNHDTTNSRLTRSLEDTKHNLMNDMLEDDFMDEDIKDAAEQQTILLIRKELLRILRCENCLIIIKFQDSIFLQKLHEVANVQFSLLVKEKTNFNIGKHYDLLLNTAINKLALAFEGYLLENHKDENNKSTHLQHFLKTCVEITLNIRIKRYCAQIRPFKQSTRSKYTKLILFEGH